MSGGVGGNSRPASYYVDRALIPRVKSYLKENSHRTYINIEEMADLLQRTNDQTMEERRKFHLEILSGKVCNLTVTKF